MGILVIFACRYSRKEFSPKEKVSLKTEKVFLFKKGLFYKWKGFTLSEKDLHNEKLGGKLDEKDLLFIKRFFKWKGFLLFFSLAKEMKWKENYFYQPDFMIEIY